MADIGLTEAEALALIAMVKYSTAAAIASWR